MTKTQQQLAKRESVGALCGFVLSDVNAELIETAKKVAYDYEHEFLPTEDESNCRFCGYKFYCTKWDE